MVGYLCEERQAAPENDRKQVMTGLRVGRMRGGRKRFLANTSRQEARAVRILAALTIGKKNIWNSTDFDSSRD